jgi:Protein of unknown function (DUF3631)
MPSDLNDRQQDVCEPLIAIADLVGGQWPDRARQALISLLVAQSTTEDPIRARLLADIQLCFEKPATDRMKRALYLCEGTLRTRTSDLLDGLIAIEEAPWAEYRRGRPLSACELARLLKPFDIRRRDLRFDDKVYKGYEQTDFEDAWARYSPRPDLQGQQGQQASVYAGSDDLPEGQHTPTVAPAKIEESPVNTLVVADVAPERRDKGNGSVDSRCRDAFTAENRGGSGTTDAGSVECVPLSHLAKPNTLG